jgi:hypothetical protein
MRSLQRVESGFLVEGGNRCNCKKRNGRHEETRTPDLYRVKITNLGFSIT